MDVFFDILFDKIAKTAKAHGWGRLALISIKICAILVAIVLLIGRLRS